MWGKKGTGKHFLSMPIEITESGCTVYLSSLRCKFLLSKMQKNKRISRLDIFHTNITLFTCTTISYKVRILDNYIQ